MTDLVFCLEAKMSQHLSIRIPWKDNGYCGLVCNKPCYNTACLRLKNIAESRNDDFEEKLSGKPILGHEKQIPCLSEGGCFMSAQTYKTYEIHPYKNSSPETHGHFLPTELVYPPYSFPARPYGWMLRSKKSITSNDNIGALKNKFGIEYDTNYEPELPFNTYWVQDARNHRAILKSFFEDVTPNKSLVIPYAKQVPFIDDSKRVVMGIGFVSSILEAPEHKHTNQGQLRSMLWETMVSHTIRDDRQNGFLLPYREMMEYAKTHPEFDMRSITVFADEEYFEEFSYATEHVSYDAVISVLLQIINSLRIIKECKIPGNWSECITWTKKRLEETWIERGLFPGFGSMLHALGFTSYGLIATAIKKSVKDESDFENKAENILKNPSIYLSPEIAKKIDRNSVRTYFSLSVERRKLFWLLSRMSISEVQAYTLFNIEERRMRGIRLIDIEILKNPYLLYEQTRLLSPEYSVSAKTVDMAVFPAEIIRDINPLAAPSALDSENDERRIRAYIVSQLELQASQGHTIYPKDFIVKQINNLSVDPPVKVTGDLINIEESFYEEEINIEIGEEGDKFYQLNRLKQYDDIIRDSVKIRMEGKRLDVKENWARFVDEEFARKHVPDFKEKQIAREERIAILKELAASKLSVLIGGAGTGKTTLLALLCKSSQISNGRILLLAPTGKARVRISQAMTEHGVLCQAKTVAQFLTESDRYDGKTGQYRLSSKEAQNVASTVVIDESSMLTEEMFGALIQALRKKAQRIIFLGDPNQLPPIGAGRPFVDLVEKLGQDVNSFPHVAPGFGELTVNMRQLAGEGENREDTELAKWFTRNPSDLDDDIFDKLQSGKLGDRVVFKKWNTPEELEKRIFETIYEETHMHSVDDIEGFNRSLGGVINGEWMNFGSKPEMVEDWQILSPYRNNAEIGTATINRYIHEKYKSQTMLTLPHCKVRATKFVLGTEGIVYGDKVINIKNQSKKTASRNDEDGYVANGEVGIVENLWHKSRPYTHQIKFSSQPDTPYKWYSSVSDEGTSDIELAYALTVHKSQGSEFGKAILILSEPSRMLSRELLYTAITRQKNKLIILYNEDAIKLRDYADPFYSEVAKRLTCLFKEPSIAEINNIYFEKSLIHLTLKGHLVRSKSEVIIANMLYSAGIDYEYEKQLMWDNGDKLLPDFTIEDIEHDVCIYWEHCGMLGDYSYRQHWEEKKKIYALHGIKEGDNLLVSKDSLNGAINSADLQQIIDVLKDVLGISDEGNGNDNAYDNISTNENLEEKDNQPIDYESLNGSYALNEDLIPAALRDNAIDLPVTGDLDGWYYLVQFDGRLDNYTHKNTEEMRILVLINGSERSIKVNVMREDHIIYISQTMFSLFEAELSDPDGIKIVF